MGLTIYYSGELKSPPLLPELIEEVKDIAKVNQWKFHVFETQFPEDRFTEDVSNDDLYGICVTAPECETLSICFLSNGKMSGPLQVSNWKNSTNEKEKSYLYMCWVKTQFAGPKTHIIIVKILKHLEQKYFINFTVEDEGSYWQTNNENILLAQFKLYNSLIDNFKIGMEVLQQKEGENIFDYLSRIADMVHNKNKKK